jgi:uncharacterized protein (DUF433 family)
MALVIDTEKAPITVDADGVARVADTRVTLDVIVSAFEDGATAEEIAQKFPTVDLTDVYAVITYYLRRRDQVAQYMRERAALGKKVRQENEARYPSDGMRARLLARRAGKQ